MIDLPLRTIMRAPFPTLVLGVGLILSSVGARPQIVTQQPGEGKSKTNPPQAGRDGVSMPACVFCPGPKYSQEARKKKYEGVVVLLVVVTTEGQATDIQVMKGPGLGLHEKAIEAVRKWKFKPPEKDGVPVAAQVPIEVSFRLH